jgi:threonine synthase
MDITVASNYERLVFDLFENDPNQTRAYMEQFESTGRVKFSEHGLPDDILSLLAFDSGTSTHNDRLDSIRWAYRQGGGVIDPHTADAVTVARRKKLASRPIVCMSTALAVKFEDTIHEALGFVPPREERFEGIEERAIGGFTLLANDPEAVKDFIRQNS